MNKKWVICCPNIGEHLIFKDLKKLGYDEGVHPKEISAGVNLFELATLINKFKTGIAGLLVELHLLFKDRIPSL